MDGQPIETFWQVRRYLDGYSPEQGPIEIVVERGESDRHTLSITPQATKRTDAFLDFSEEDYLLGYQPFYVDTTIGIVNPKSSAAQSGLKTSDVIHSVDGHAVTNYVELLERLNAIPPGHTVTIKGERKGESLFPSWRSSARKSLSPLNIQLSKQRILGLVHGGVCVASVNPDGSWELLEARIVSFR